MNIQLVIVDTYLLFIHRFDHMRIYITLHVILHVYCVENKNIHTYHAIDPKAPRGTTSTTGLLL